MFYLVHKLAQGRAVHNSKKVSQPQSGLFIPYHLL